MFFPFSDNNAFKIIHLAPDIFVKTLLKLQFSFHSFYRTLKKKLFPIFFIIEK